MSENNGGVHKGHRERMREKFKKNGLEGFSEHEIIEMLLYYCIPRKNTNQLAHDIMAEYKNLANVFDASVEELMHIDGVSEVTATLLSMVPELAKRYEVSKWDRKKCLPDTESIGRYAVTMLKDAVYENFALICLDSNRRVKSSGIIVKGTIDRTEAYPRVVVYEALKQNATSVVFAHNHPDGTLVPSLADKVATEELVKILGSIGIKVLDHIIVSGNRYFSMQEMGFKF